MERTLSYILYFLAGYPSFNISIFVESLRTRTAVCFLSVYYSNSLIYETTITIGAFCTGQNALLADLMTKSFIRGNLTRFNADIQATHKQGLDYILGSVHYIPYLPFDLFLIG